MPNTLSNIQITWSDLIETTITNLIMSIQNIGSATIPDAFKNVAIQVAEDSAKIQVNHGPKYVPVKTFATSTTNWENLRVDESTIRADFNRFLNDTDLSTAIRQNQLVSMRLMLNFFENLSLYYNNRLLIVYSPISNSKQLYYYNNNTYYSSWVGHTQNIESPVQDLPVTAQEVNDMLASIDLNLKNKVKVYNQTYTFTTTSSSSCSSCSSSSSSSSSCWTIVHQDLSLL